jgi:hypothetical protein
MKVDIAEENKKVKTPSVLKNINGIYFKLKQPFTDHHLKGQKVQVKTNQNQKKSESKNIP